MGENTEQPSINPDVSPAKNDEENNFPWERLIQVFQLLGSCAAALAAIAAFQALTLNNSINRAWLSADPDLQSIVYNGTKLVGQMTMTFQNFGHLPATDVKFFPGLFSSSPEMALTRQAEICSAVQQNDPRIFLHPPVYPGATIKTPVFAVLSKINWLQNRSEPRIWLGGCVTYRFSGSNDPHKTNFLYQLGTGSNELFEIEKDEVKRNLHFYANWRGGFDTD